MIGLHSRIQPYAWGSSTAIAAMQGRPVPAPGPEAELWLGAHPSAPSTALLSSGPRSLAELITAEPARWLGPPAVERFGPRLPFLLKVLAAAAPLSLQVHPDAAQAAAGHARDPRNYVDPYHKPELLVALDDFEALCGFRDPLVTAAQLAELDRPALAPLIDGLSGQGLRGAVELVLGLPEAERVSLVDEVAAVHPLAARLAAGYPGDAGVVLALLLNHVTLRPGQAVYMPAGNLHAYLRGLGVEVMAASDNVLRGGLTPKHVDVAEFMGVLRYEVLADPVVEPVPLGPGLATWLTPVREFSLVRAVTHPDTLASVTLPAAGPRVVVCVAGPAELSTGADWHRLGGGEGVFVAPDEPAVTVRGNATVFQARPAL